MKRLQVLLLAAVLGGCATAPRGSSGLNEPADRAGANPADPWESWNRKVFGFNDKVDSAVLKPVAQGYRAVVPELVRSGIDNVLGNIGDVGSTLNQFLQGKVQTGLEMGMRVVVNTTFGLGGLLDPATEMHLTRRNEDFGQTLGKWGVPSGPYIVLPLLGPSSVRDGLSLPVEYQYAPAALAHTNAGAYGLTTLSLVNTRSNLLSTTQLLDDVALDRYSFTRDVWLQRRRNQVYDGEPPLEKLDDEPAPAAPPQPPAKPK